MLNFFKDLNFAKNSKTGKLFLNLILSSEKKVILQILGLNLISNIFEILGLAFFVSLLFDDNHITNLFFINNNSVKASFLLFLLIMIIRNIINSQIRISIDEVRTYFLEKLRQESLMKIIYTSKSQIDKLGKSELINLLINEISRSVMALDKGLIFIQSSLGLSIYLLGIIFISSGNLNAIFLGFIASILAALLKPSLSAKYGSLITKNNINIQKLINDSISGMKTLKAYAAEEWIIKKFVKQSNNLINIALEISKRKNTYQALRDSLLVLIVGIWLFFFTNDYSKSLLITTLIFSYRAAIYLSQIIQSKRICIEMLSGYEEFLRIRNSIINLNEYKKLTSFKKENYKLIKSLRDVKTISWENSKIKNFSKNDFIEISKGKLITITGNSASGKTSILDSFFGISNVSNSEWEFSNTNKSFKSRDEFGASLIKSLTTYLPQNVFLFEGTIKENIVFDCISLEDYENKISDKRIIDWFYRLRLNHLIKTKHDLEKVLNLSYLNLSGGEIQRIGLIRTFIKNNPIELYDEPTTYLDRELSEIVIEILIERSEKKLILVASHDEELIKRSSNIINIEKNK